MLGLRCGWPWAEDMAGQAASAANTAIVAKRFMTIPLFRSVDRAGGGVPRCGDDGGRAPAFLRGLFRVLGLEPVRRPDLLQELLVHVRQQGVSERALQLQI